MYDGSTKKAVKKEKGCGPPVQYLVFEAILGKVALARMGRMVKTEIKDGDSVRYYFLCESCRTRIVAIRGTVIQEVRTIVV